MKLNLKIQKLIINNYYILLLLLLDIHSQKHLTAFMILGYLDRYF